LKLTATVVVPVSRFSTTMGMASEGGFEVGAVDQRGEVGDQQAGGRHQLKLQAVTPAGSVPIGRLSSASRWPPCSSTAPQLAGWW
jgi:hypothetical protein